MIRKILILSLFFMNYQAMAQSVDTLKYCVGAGGIGVGGYDPVSYFISQSPTRGSEKFTFLFEGVEYRFSSDRNKKEFAGNPQKFLPQFGGWCSMTMVMGRATAPTYTNFLIKDGKFYLFERTLSVNGKELWLKNRTQNEKIAAENYNRYIKSGKIR